MTTITDDEEDPDDISTFVRRKIRSFKLEDEGEEGSSPPPSRQVSPTRISPSKPTTFSQQYPSLYPSVSPYNQYTPPTINNFQQSPPFRHTIPNYLSTSTNHQDRHVHFEDESQRIPKEKKTGNDAYVILLDDNFKRKPFILDACGLLGDVLILLGGMGSLYYGYNVGKLPFEYFVVSAVS